MALRQCDKCSEMVDEAKAFCPGCGTAFVAEEKRQEASNFEKLDPTFQFGPTVYNQMLEDMGLNISSMPNPVERRVEVIAPITAESAPLLKVKASVPLKPVANPPEKVPEKIPEKRAPSSNAKWYILIGVAVIILLPIALTSAILLVLEVLSRLK